MPQSIEKSAGLIGQKRIDGHEAGRLIERIVDEVDPARDGTDGREGQESQRKEGRDGERDATKEVGDHGLSENNGPRHASWLARPVTTLTLCPRLRTRASQADSAYSRSRSSAWLRTRSNARGGALAPRRARSPACANRASRGPPDLKSPAP